MTSFRYILASLRHYRRIHWAVAMGVAVATAVLTGALLVGDSVRGSLRDLTLERLGYIDSALVTSHMFRAALADELAADAGFQKFFTDAEPAILMTGTLQSGRGKDIRRATAISIVGCRNSFGSLRYGKPPGAWTVIAAAPPSVPYLQNDEMALTEQIAGELGIQKGDSVLLRIPVAGAMPADSPLGEKTDTSVARQFKVVHILSANGQARFGLMPSQHSPRNAFVPLETLQGILKTPGKANAILVAAAHADTAAGEEARRALNAAFKPQLEDMGVRAEEIKSPVDVFQLSAEQLVLPDAVVRAAETAFPGETQAVVTYLANTISIGGGESARKIPYSVVTGVDSKPSIGPLLNEGGQPIVLADDEIALNKWAADDLGAKVGDNVTIKFYEPESTHGILRERETPPLTLRAIVPLETADGKPTAAADPKLTPEMPGVTDQKSISDWDLPFPLVEKIRPQDEEYWDKYRTTPKAFVSLATAKKLWPSRWGTISLLRSGIGKGTAGKYEAVLQHELRPGDLGMSFMPVKEQGLAASSGTTPFGVLFLLFSFFLIAAAVLLMALLFQLGIQQRVGEVGTLAAVGMGRRRIAAMLSREGVIVAAVGATIGVAAGVMYAGLVIFGLRTWWVAAISTPFLKLHVGWLSLVIGWIVGVLVSWLAVWWSIRKLVRLPVSRLLVGADVFDASSAALVTASMKWSRLVGWTTIRKVLIVLAVCLCVCGFFLRGELQAGSFFGSGAVVLVLLLGEIRHRLRQGTLTRRRGAATLSQRERGNATFSLLKLSALNTARNPGRATLTVGLVAAASFLIVAVSAFRLDTGKEGTGGFAFTATSDQPIHYDLNTADGRRELGFSDDASQQLEGRRVYSLRVAAGEDASCLNLYQPTQPQVLGVPKSLVERGGFAWSATTKGLGDKPWAALEADLGRDENGAAIVPAVLDISTAVYSLHLKGVGSRLTIHDGAERPVTIEVVGLLNNSVLQGNLLVSEKNFLKLFPDTGGYRFFLIDQSLVSGERSSSAIAQLLEASLAEEGFDVREAREQLAQFLAVQNTYLSTFQSLGALGLLLGTVGLAVVQLRSVLERRGELALMRAGGFDRRRLTWMVVGENGVLLLGGLVVGCVAAAIALIPQWAPHGASVPWAALAILLGAIAVVGVVAGWLATRGALVAPIVPALRGD